MKKIRIGNDIHFKWMITRDGAVENFKGKSVEVVLRDGSGKSWPVKWEVNEKDGCVDGVMYGQMQRSPGVYSLTLVENFGQKGMSTVDCIGAWQLVARQNNAVEGDDESGLGVSVVEMKGDLSVGGGADNPAKRKRPNYFIFRRAIRYRSADDKGKRMVYMSRNPHVLLPMADDDHKTASVYVDGKIQTLAVFGSGQTLKVEKVELSPDVLTDCALLLHNVYKERYGVFVEKYEENDGHLDIYLGGLHLRENDVPYSNFNVNESSSRRYYIDRQDVLRVRANIPINLRCNVDGQIIGNIAYVKRFVRYCRTRRKSEGEGERTYRFVKVNNRRYFNIDDMRKGINDKIKNFCKKVKLYGQYRGVRSLETLEVTIRKTGDGSGFEVIK